MVPFLIFPRACKQQTIVPQTAQSVEPVLKTEASTATGPLFCVCVRLALRNDGQYPTHKNVGSPAVFRNSNNRLKGGAMKELMPAPQFHHLLHPYSTCLVSCCNAEAEPGATSTSSPPRG